MMKKRWHRIALAGASLGGTAGMMIMSLPLIPQVNAKIDHAVMSEMGLPSQAPVPPHVMRYGAFAYAPSGAWGRSLRYPLQSAANQVALEQCGDKDCKIIISFNLCGAVASDGSTYQGGRGYTRKMAEDDALNGLGGGKIVNWACN
ncbi:DUF4189 domain-containing protein [Mycobacterium intracellulare]|uniref:DUF4189 domain-containing protein n=1 Tax=Mycobacterium intracellulare TaxID=1767 RepID=UPI0006CA826A|nr:DUF4189 domain-containing protein [Mycobacterium intracellulare]KPN48046.1 hypothetical protein AN933_23750 [Mycobacterium intracellulare subsp. chimaera]